MGRTDQNEAGRDPRQVDSRSSAGHPIRFGTSGWRGALGEEVTWPRLRVLVRAVSAWIKEEAVDDRVLIGWDRRFASASMAEMTAQILVEEGLLPILATTVTPTPAISHAIRQQPCAAGLVLTASHNPPQDHGLKVFGSWGGSITDDHARRIEALARSRMADDGPSERSAIGTRCDFNSAYLDSLTECLDTEALGRAGLTVVYDAMHGAGAGVLDRVLERAGVRIEGLRFTGDPYFGGGSPDPVAERLTALAARVPRAKGLRLGLATDGDADRIGAVDGLGRLLSESQVIALLVDHLASVGLVVKGVAITAATGSIVERVAAHHGLAVERHPIGFKHLSAAMEAGRVDVAGEESGGFALARMGRDKDGILAGCLLANLVALSGDPLETHLERLERRFGSSACGRVALAKTPGLDLALVALESAPPDRIGRTHVVDIDRRSGLRLMLADGGFVMFRRSGTEPMLRVYAEARDHVALDRRLEDAARLLEACRAGP